MLQKYQWLIFWLTCATVGFALMVRIWILAPLYVDPALRSRTQALIEATAKREGWLLSGVRIDAIHNDHLRVLYRSYLRGKDPILCHHISYSTGKLFSCVDS